MIINSTSSKWPKKSFLKPFSKLGQHINFSSVFLCNFFGIYYNQRWTTSGFFGGRTKNFGLVDSDSCLLIDGLPKACTIRLSQLVLLSMVSCCTRNHDRKSLVWKSMMLVNQTIGGCIGGIGLDT